MPIIYSESRPKSFNLCVAHNTEALQYFTASVPTESLTYKFDQLKESRIIEILSTHKLIADLVNQPGTIQFAKDIYNKPQLIDSDLNISISHSSDFTAAIVSNFDVGIDIQQEVSKIYRIKHKFLSDEEIAFIEEANDLEMLHVMWGAKESMYKAYGKKKVTFKTELIINPFKYNPEGTHFTGSVQKNDYNESFDIYARKIENFYLVFAILNDRSMQAG